MTYQDIIAQVSGRPLKTAAPVLRIVPPADPPIVTPQESVDLLAWAKARKAKAGVMPGVHLPPPTRKPGDWSTVNKMEIRGLFERGGVFYLRIRTGRCRYRYQSLKTRDLAEAKKRRAEILNR
jgi:hypothetical protein